VKVRPFIQQLQQQVRQTLSNHRLTRPSPPSNQLWLQAQAETLAWQRSQTTEQEASYADESWVNSTPHVADMDTVAEMPVVQQIVSHIFDEPAQFAAISGPLLATQIQDKRILPRVPTSALPKPAPQTTDKLRPITVSDPYLPSVRMTPNEFAIVPRQRSTTQLPPHMRLDEDIEYSPVMPVEQLVNAAILAFHEQHHRLPHKIIIAAIRYWRYKISLTTFNPDIFYYKDSPIPITHAPIGEFGFGINEVRLD
jgi:hypothetical protein